MGFEIHARMELLLLLLLRKGDNQTMMNVLAFHVVRDVELLRLVVNDSDSCTGIVLILI